MSGFVWCLVLIPFLGYAAAQANHPWSSWTALDDYVNRPDPNYSWRQVAQYRRERATVYCINMTSQMWKDSSVHSQPLWWHQLIIAIPDDIDYFDTALVYISTGSNTDTDPPPETDWRVNASAAFASEMNGVAAYLKQIPNQPIVFTADETQTRRWEDRIIGWTWRRFVMEENGTDPEILLRMPMIKAVVRAFDTIATFANQINNSFNIDKFVPAGESKRGWTTWMVGAVDRRVVGIAPMVLSFMNFKPMLQKYWRSLGGWTFAFNSYWREGLTTQIGSPLMDRMADHIDPYSYRDRLNVPIFYMAAGGDEFFPPDDTNLFWSDLKDNPKMVTVLPNTGHSLRGPGTRDTIFWNLVAFYHCITDDIPFPDFSYTYEFNSVSRDGSITVTTVDVPVSARVRWSSTTDLVAPRRDFRQRILNGSSVIDNPATWYEDTVVDLGDGVLLATYDYPDQGYMAFYIELEYLTQNLETIILTTEAITIPPTFPYPGCQFEECTGTLV